MAHGYSANIVKEIAEANPTLLGVKLGRICVEKDIPVVDVATFLGVTRVTVYAWFRGKSAVSDKYAGVVQNLITKLG